MSKSRDEMCKLIKSIRLIPDDVQPVIKKAKAVYTFDGMEFHEPVDPIRKARHELAMKEAELRSRIETQKRAEEKNLTLQELLEQEEIEEKAKAAEERKMNLPKMFTPDEVYKITHFDRVNQLPRLTEAWAIVIIVSMWLLIGWWKALTYPDLMKSIFVIGVITILAGSITYLLFYLLVNDKYRYIFPIELIQIQCSQKYKNLHKILDLCTKYNTWVELYFELEKENPDHIPVQMKLIREFLKEYRTKLKIHLMTEASNVKVNGKLTVLPEDLLNPETSLFEVMKEFVDKKEVERIEKELMAEGC